MGRWKNQEGIWERREEEVRTGEGGPRTSCSHYSIHRTVKLLPTRL